MVLRSLFPAHPSHEYAVEVEWMDESPSKPEFYEADTQHRYVGVSKILATWLIVIHFSAFEPGPFKHDSI